MTALPIPRASVDALGLLCPLPILRLEQAAARLESGAVVELLADDQAIEDDLPAWCEGNGHELLQLDAVESNSDGAGKSQRPSWRALVRLGASKR